jgi:branched-chain amino acid transport system permease protein
VFLGSYNNTVNVDQFEFGFSVFILAMVIVGGMGNIWGVAAGAFIVFMIQAVVLKQISAIVEALNGAGIPMVFDIGPIHIDILHVNFVEYQYLLFGIALVVMMLRRPEGLFPSQVRRAELHEINEELAPDEVVAATIAATESEDGVAAPGSQT